MTHPLNGRGGRPLHRMGWTRPPRDGFTRRCQTRSSLWWRDCGKQLPTLSSVDLHLSGNTLLNCWLGFVNQLELVDTEMDKWSSHKFVKVLVIIELELRLFHFWVVFFFSYCFERFLHYLQSTVQVACQFYWGMNKKKAFDIQLQNHHYLQSTVLCVVVFLSFTDRIPGLRFNSVHTRITMRFAAHCCPGLWVLSRA